MLTVPEGGGVAPRAEKPAVAEAAPAQPTAEAPAPHVERSNLTRQVRSHIAENGLNALSKFAGEERDRIFKPLQTRLLDGSGYVCDANTVAIWSLDEDDTTLYNSCGGYNMIRSGLTSVTGVVGGAQNGTSGGYASTGTNQSVLTNLTGGITIDLWVKNMPSPGSNSILIGNGGETGSCGARGFSLYNAPGNKLRIGYGNSTLPCEYTVPNGELYGSNTPWHHIAATWDGTMNPGGLNIYIDGQLKQSCTSPVMPSNNATCKYVVGRSVLNTAPARGWYDQVRVSNIGRDASWVADQFSRADEGNLYPPVLNSLTPSSVTAGSGAFTLTANGTKFETGAVVRVNGSDRVTTYVSSTELTASILASDISAGGTKTITVYNPLAASASGDQTLTINNPSPTTSSISPNTRNAASGNFTITVNGTNFTSSSVVKINGTNLTTTYINSTQLTATVLSAQVASAGTYSITVFNTTPGGGTSGAQTLTVNNPVPTVSTISPTTKAAGSATFTLTVNGTGFVPQSTVVLSGSPMPTTYVSGTQLTASIDAGNVASAVEHVVYVFNDAPGGGTSNTRALSVTNSSPTISSLSPNTKNVGDATFTLSVNGTGFNTGSVVYVDSVARSTSYVSGHLEVTIDASELLATGSKTIYVTNPAPGGGTTGNLTLTVNYASPTLSSISPSSQIAGGGDFTLTATGTGFTSASEVRVNGVSRTTAFVSTTQLQAAMLASDIVSGNKTITVFTPTPGGGTSGGQTLFVTAAGASTFSLGYLSHKKIVNSNAGTNNSTTFSISPGANNEWYSRVTGLGDIDNDGIPDFAGGAYLANGNGAVYVHRLNSDGSLKGTVKIGQGFGNSPTNISGAQFGIGTAYYGTRKMLVGAFAVNRAYLLNLNTDGSVVAGGEGVGWTQFSGSGGYGGCVATIGQLNSGTDSIADIAVSSVSANQINVHFMTAGGVPAGGGPTPIGNGTAQTGGGTLSVSGGFGSSCAGMGDLDGDGVPDLAVGAYNAALVKILFLNTNGTLKGSATITAADAGDTGGGAKTFGTSMGNAGDMDGNGINDLFVGDDSQNKAFLILLNSGGTVKDKYTFGSNLPIGNPAVSGSYGMGVAGIGDVDNNGAPDLVIGAFTDSTGGTNMGATYVTLLQSTVATPTISSISPNTKTAGDAGFTVTVNGTNFVTGSVVRIGGVDRSTTFGTSGQITASILAGDIATAGIYSITVFNPGAGGSSTAASLTVNNPSPTLSSISPTSKNVGDSTFTLTLTGTGFNTQSVARIGGMARTTTYVNATTLQATIPSTDLLATGTPSITVFNPTPGGGTSSGQTLSINNPAPTTSAISPSSVTAGAGTLTMSVTGTGFNSSSVVYFDNAAQTTTLVSGHLEFSVNASSMTTAGTHTVKVVNPSPGGGTSTPNLTFTVNNPMPVTTDLSHPTKLVGSSTFTLTVNGSGFNASSVVYFDNAAQTTTLNGGALEISVNASVMTTAGTHAVKVINPTPGGGTSTPDLAFVVENAFPTTSSLSPSTKNIGDAGFTMQVNGSGFNDASVVYFDDAAQDTDYVSGHLEFDVDGSVMNAAGAHTVRVVNPAPGGGTSTPDLTFNVNNPAPTTTSISPTTKTAGQTAFTLTVNGTNFNASSVVRINGNAKNTTYVSPTQLTAVITALDISTAGSKSITVFNPTPGGGTSGAQTLTVNTAITATVTSISPTSKNVGDGDFTLTVNGTNFNNGAIVNFGGSEMPTTFVSSTQLTAEVAAADYESYGSYAIYVDDPINGMSSVATFDVGNPAPAITTIAPTSAIATSGDFTLTVNGINLTGGTEVYFDGELLTANLVSSSQLTVTVPNALIASAGSYQVQVINPAPGGGTSNSRTFTVHDNVAVSHSPTSPLTVDPVTITGDAEYASGIGSVEIRIDGNLVHTCNAGGAPSYECQYNVGTLAYGSHTANVKLIGTDLEERDADHVFHVSDYTTVNAVTLSRLRVSTEAEVTARYFLAAPITGIVTVTFPAGFTVLSAPTAEKSSPCMSQFGFSPETRTIYAMKTACAGSVVIGGATVLNPSTAGVYQVTWINDDPGGGPVYITDEDYIDVVATVDPYITFRVVATTAACANGDDGVHDDTSPAGNGGTVAFGTLSPLAVASSDASGVNHVCTFVSTNATGGYGMSVRSEFGQLYSASTTAGIPTAAQTGAAAPATASAGSQAYGMCLLSTGGVGKDDSDPVGFNIAATSPYDTSCSGVDTSEGVGTLTTSFNQIGSALGPVQDGWARWLLKTSIPATQTAAGDYEDTLTFVVTGTY